MANQNPDLQSKLARARVFRDQMQVIENGAKDAADFGRAYRVLKDKRDAVLNSLTGPETLLYSFMKPEALRYAAAEKNGRLDELKKSQENYIGMKARLTGKPVASFADTFNAQSRDIALTKSEIAGLLQLSAEAEADLRSRSSGRGEERTFRSDWDDSVTRDYAAEREVYDTLYPKRHDRSDNIDEETQARRQSEVDRIVYKGNSPREW